MLCLFQLLARDTFAVRKRAPDGRSERHEDRIGSVTLGCI